MPYFVIGSLFIVLPALLLIFYAIGARGLSRVTVFLISPWTFIVTSYALTFILRPWLIVSHGADTLDFEAITSEDWRYVYALALLSILFIVIAFVVSRRRKFHMKSERSANFTVNAINFYYALTCLSVFSLFVYGSALSNTQDRFENPGQYTFYFVFILLFKVHYIMTVALYSGVSNIHASRRRLLFILFIIAPVVQILVSGRGSGLFLIVSLLCAYVIKERINFRFSYIVFVSLLSVGLMLVNYFLSFVRVIVSANDWKIEDLFSLITFDNVNAFNMLDTLSLFSWDYSLFDVCVRIVNKSEGYMFGYTNLSYLLSYVPRLFWPSKPHDQGYMLGITDHFYNDVFGATGSTFSGMIVGEGYWNFGLLGVAAYSFIFGYVVFSYMYRALRCRDMYSISAYAIILPMTFQITRGGLDVVVQLYVMVLFPLYVITRLLTKAQSSKLLACIS